MHPNPTFIVISGCKVGYAVLLVLAIATTSTHAQSLAYVTNSCSNNVSVIDTSSRTVVETIPVGNGPNGVAITPDGAFAYVANPAASTVSIIATASNVVVATIPVSLVEGAVQGIAATPSGAFVYVSNALGSVSVIDTATKTVLTTIPASGQGLAVTPNSAFVYLANRSANTVSVIQTATQTVAATINLGLIAPGLGATDVTIAPNGTRGYVSTGRSRFYVIDLSTNTLVTSLLLGSTFSELFGLAITPDGALVYVTDFVAAAVHVIDTATNTVLTSVALTSRPKDVAFTLDGAFAYVTGQLNLSLTGNEVAVIDTATNAVVETIPVGTCPTGIAITQALSPAVQLNQLVGVVQTLGLQFGTESSFTSKLRAALAALKAGDSPTACAKVADFIRHARVQSGKKISEVQATQLIQAARQIEEALGCPATL